MMSYGPLPAMATPEQKGLPPTPLRGRFNRSLDAQMKTLRLSMAKPP